MEDSFFSLIVVLYCLINLPPGVITFGCFSTLLTSSSSFDSTESYNENTLFFTLFHVSLSFICCFDFELGDGLYGIIGRFSSIEFGYDFDNKKHTFLLLLLLIIEVNAFIFVINDSKMM